MITDCVLVVVVGKRRERERLDKAQEQTQLRLERDLQLPANRRTWDKSLWMILHNTHTTTTSYPLVTSNHRPSRLSERGLRPSLQLGLLTA